MHAETKRQRYGKLHAQLKSERQSWLPHWAEIGQYLMPWRGRFTGDVSSQANRGEKKHQSIVDATGSLALRTLAAGMMTGITSPARPWFNLTTPDPSFADSDNVKRWLSDVEDRMRAVFARSNIYNALHTLYADLGGFCTGVLIIEDDERTVIRATNLAAGTYMLATNERGEVDTLVREIAMTVRQMVQRFGIDAVSDAVKEAYESGDRDSGARTVIHIITPNDAADADKIGGKFKAWSSCYYEDGVREAEGQFLSESGYDEFPVMAPRWDTSGSNVYGDGPGMVALGDVKALQLLQKRKAQAVDKQVNPPMIAPAELATTQISGVPGGVTYATGANLPQIRPLYDIRFDIPAALQDLQEISQRINRIFFADLWLLVAMSDRRQVTAEEIRAKEQEKLLQLGPVLERLNAELLNPLIDRVFSIMLRAGLFPPPPPEMEGMDLRVEYISIMAQAQKLVGIGGVDRLFSFAGQLAQVDPTIMDKVDGDQAIDEYADMLGVSPKIVRSDEQVAEIRAQRQQAVQAQQQSESLAMAAKSARDLSGASMDGDNALTRLAGGSLATVPA